MRTVSCTGPQRGASYKITMAQLPRLDLRRLARDAAADPDAPRRALAPGGRPATGLMQAVRDNLDALLALKAEGRTWAAIAAGMTAQGFTTADGRAITERNLTGVVASVRRQTRRAAAKEAGRRDRGDLRDEESQTATLGSAPSSTTTNSARQGPSLSPDLVREAATSLPLRPAEDERRRAALARAQSLLKKD